MRNALFYGQNAGNTMRNAIFYFISHSVMSLIYKILLIIVIKMAEVVTLDFNGEYNNVIF